MSDTRIGDSMHPQSRQQNQQVTNGVAKEGALPIATDKHRYPKVRQYHGLTTARTSLRRLGEYAIGSVLDDATGASSALVAWRDTIASTLGAALTPQLAMVLELACRDRLMLDTMDRWILNGERRLINKRRRALYPIVVQRSAVARSLTDHLKTLASAAAAAVATTENGLVEEDQQRRAELIEQLMKAFIERA